MDPDQSEINIGLVGHVDHGKTTLNQALTGVWADKHSEEIRRGITIRLGYSDVVFYKCPKCDEPKCYTTKEKCEHCGSKCKPSRKISFVDCPGHESLMATMLSGAMVMNGAMLLIAANEECPQPQTKEHLAAIEISGVENIIIVQNKIDLVSRERAEESHNEIKEFLSGTIAEDAPIIPISAHHTVNIDALIMAIEKHILTQEFDPKKPPLMLAIRSFDINKPGTEIDGLQGGIIGGSLIQGELKEGDDVEIAPGRRIVVENKSEYVNYKTKVTTLMAGSNKLKTARPGGLLGVGTLLDPSVTKSDSLSGTIIAKPDNMPPVVDSLTIEPHLLDFVVGTDEDIKVDPIKSGEPLMLVIATTPLVGVATSAREDLVDIKLKRPAVIQSGHRIALSRRIKDKWRLIGYGITQP